jgi:hypothetical protein
MRFRPAREGLVRAVLIFDAHGELFRAFEVKKNHQKDITINWANRRPDISYWITDEEGYVSCRRCDGTGLLRRLLRKTRDCPKCLGEGRVLSGLQSGGTGFAVG